MKGKEEFERKLRQKLKEGIPTTRSIPHYFNAVVGAGNVGYVVSVIFEGQQYNLLLKVANTKELFVAPVICMTIHSIFFYSGTGAEKNIESALVGKTVVLKPAENQHLNIINPFYAINGLITLETEPP